MLKKCYNILRDVVVAAVVAIAALYLLIYMAVSLPPVQSWLGKTVASALQDYLGGEVEISKVEISPFNRLTLTGVKMTSPERAKVADIDRLGAGISLTDLLIRQRIVVTYAEIVGMDAYISQPREDAPLNIQYIVDALSPKDKNKPPTKFDLAIHSVVLRRCNISYDRLWMPRLADEFRFDPNHIAIRDLRADIDLPRIANDDFSGDVKRMSFVLGCGLDIKMLKLRAHVTKTHLKVEGLSLQLPNSNITLPDIELSYADYNDILPSLKRNPQHIMLSDCSITPADLACFMPELKRFDSPMTLKLDATVSQTSADIQSLDLDYDALQTHIHIADASVSGWNNPERLHFSVGNLDIATTTDIMHHLSPFVTIPSQVMDRIQPLGTIHLVASGNGMPHDFVATADLQSDAGNLYVDGRYNRAGVTHSIEGTVGAENLQLGRITGVEDLGTCTLQANADLRISGKDISGSASLEAPLLTYRDYPYRNITAEMDGSLNAGHAHLSIDDPNVALDMDLDHPDKASLLIDLTLDRLHPAVLNLPQALHSIPEASFTLQASLHGTSLADLDADAEVRDLRLWLPDKFIGLDKIQASLLQEDGTNDHLSLHSDIASFDAHGDINLATLPGVLRGIVHRSLISPYIAESTSAHDSNNFTYTLQLYQNEKMEEILHLPVQFPVAPSINGAIDGGTMQASLDIHAPWIQQKNKIIEDTRLSVRLDGDAQSAYIHAASTLPAKKSNVRLQLDARAARGDISTDIAWEFFKDSAYRGSVGIDTHIERNPMTGAYSALAQVRKSDFMVNDTVWHIDPASIELEGSDVAIKGLKIWREGQYALIDGELSANPDHQLKLILQSIDLSYIFDILDINYVNFGGVASGEFFVSNLAGGMDNLMAYTPALTVKDFMYNNARLGDAEIHSRWVGAEKMVHIDADIKDGPEYYSKINGGIWVTRDSLSFNFDAHGVNVKFMQPFMSAFSSDVSGRASGNATLYGTFSDINLVGKLRAHPLKLKVDYTNVYYTCNDSVIIVPDTIKINNATIMDRDGNTAMLNGYVSHRYFHEPVFEFKLSDAEHILCYDTNAKINPIWYGTIYGTGGGTISGYPGLVDINVQMTTAPGSKFTFVLDKSEVADEYRFLSFTDKRRQAQLAAMPQPVDTVPPIVRQLRQQIQQQTESSSVFKMDLRATVTPDAQLTIVMDPIGGDDIRGYGSGSLQIGYSSEGDKFTMKGKYTLDRGIYRFTLQDLILKDFIIRPGSSIEFDEDPYDAHLDITAAYRVTTNLADLDKSFATDRELTRTNVPVEALLMVRGPMQQPEITFDIDIPSVTQDVLRKVKSIISTDDMMSIQIFYLLGLNRFYTPDYTGTQRNNNELASVASSTVSAQIGNAFGRLSDNWTFTPYFRTDKGDFSDLEVDLALSSSLLNNRLLLNGNLGYRDRSTSTTTFIGDFDIEYLLNRQGSIRLKAYNHFNDANYYLRSALTTQGVGVVYKLEFDDLRNLFRRRRRQTTVPTDTVPTVPTDTVPETRQE